MDIRKITSFKGLLRACVCDFVGGRKVPEYAFFNSGELGKQVITFGIHWDDFFEKSDNLVIQLHPGCNINHDDRILNMAIIECLEKSFKDLKSEIINCFSHGKNYRFDLDKWTD